MSGRDLKRGTFAKGCVPLEKLNMVSYTRRVCVVVLSLPLSKDAIDTPFLPYALLILHVTTVWSGTPAAKKPTPEVEGCTI